MSGNGCSCAGSTGQLMELDLAAVPGSGGLQSTEVVWETLVLDANATEVSLPIPTGGANAVEIVVITINSSGSIQTVFQAQVGCDGAGWSNFGSAGQCTTIGITTIGPLAGNGSSLFRLVAVEQASSRTLFTIAVRFFRN